MVFEPTKEHFSIICRTSPEGPPVSMLGLTFDTKLRMDGAVATLTGETSWKLRTLLRTRRFFDTKSLVHLFKSRILGYVEYRTPAIYHATATSLDRLDGVYRQLLRTANLSEEDALLNFGLAPLNARRDIAMLGVIHRTVLGLGPRQFRKFIRLAGDSLNPGGRVALNNHDRQLVSFRKGNYLDMVSHSLLGAIDVYNLLPGYVVDAGDVSAFQNRLQQLLKVLAKDGIPGWQRYLSNRHMMFLHPLRNCGGFDGPGTKECVTEIASGTTYWCVKGWLEFGQNATIND